jgi:Mitochondrial ATPase expression
MREELLDALHANDSEALLDVATLAFQDRDLVASLPATTIAQVFDSMRFDNVLSKHKEYSWLSPKNIESARKAGWAVRPIIQVFDDLLASYTRLFDGWLAAEHPININICKSFLRLTSAAGNTDIAREIRMAAEKSGLVWDTEAYNLLLEAICWERAYHPLQARSLRVTEQSLSLRSRQPKNMPPAFIGHTAEIKNEAVDVFEEMIKKGNTADSLSFGLLMVAMGRMGDLQSVEGTLKRVWGVDVAGVREHNSAALYFENDIPPDSHLYPTEDILFYVAHIYGSNNELGMALKLVDFISQKYSLSVNEKTGEELLRWSFILSRQRGGEFAHSQQKRDLQQSLALGKVPQHAFSNLYDLLLQPPYNIRPTQQMYNWRFASLRRQGARKRMRALLRSIYKRSAPIESRARLRDTLGSYSIQNPGAAQRSEMENLEVLASSAVLTRSIRLVLGFHPTRDKRGYLTRWIPRFIGEWGNLWFCNTHRALFYHVLSWSGLTFHRQMQDENPAEMEVFATGSTDRYIVRPRKSCLALPFCEKTQAQRREARRMEGIAAGQNLRYNTPWEWYDLSKIQDWVWFSSGRGVRLPDAQFDLDSGHFIPSSESFGRLSKAEAVELRERVAQQ